MSRNPPRALAANARTKLLNEGWGTYVHVHIKKRLFHKDLLTREGHGTFNKFHSEVLRENNSCLNWYQVGVVRYEYVKGHGTKAGSTGSPISARAR